MGLGRSAVSIMSITKKSTIGGYTFEEVFRKETGGIRIPYVLLTSVAKWLGEGWSQKRCEDILKAEPWISDALGRTDDDAGFGLSPIGIAMLVAHGGPDVSPSLKMMASDLVIGWVSGRTKCQTSFEKNS